MSANFAKISMGLNNSRTQDLSHTCRTCLETESDLTSIFDSKAAEMLNYCDFCVVSENDGFPNKICLVCMQILEQSYKFKKQCENSYAVLTKQLSAVDEREDLLELKHNASDEPIDPKHEHELFRPEVESSEQVNELESDNEQKKEDSEEVNEDLISFLDKPLPPPLPHVCHKCEQSFSEENDLKIHQSVHGDKMVCLACSKKFTTRQILKRHLKIHLIKKPHVCKICSKSFPESYALTKHLRRHSGIPREKKHFCAECGQGFSEPYYLKVHIRKHTGERPLSCSACHKTFADPRSLKIHVMIHSGEKPHKCNFCLKSFIQRANLTKHLRIHTGEKPYVCKTCGKKFSQSSSLDKHHRTHTGEKLYACDKCDKRFTEKSTLNNHVKIHTKGNLYTCAQCLDSFVSKSELLSHRKQHGEIKSRTVCKANEYGKQFPKHSALLEHHTGKKPYECGTCFRKFIHKSSLNKHSKTHEKGLSDKNSTFITCDQFEQPAEDCLGLNSDNNLYTANTFL